MSSYRLSAEYCDRAPLRGVIFSAVVFALAAPIACGVVWYNMIRTGTDVGIVLISSACVLPLLFLTGGGAAVRTYFRSRDTLRGFELILERDELTRVSPGLADLTLYRGEVTQITEKPGAGMVIRTADPRRLIFVPAGLAGYEEFRERMAEWADLRPSPARNYLGWAALFGLTATLVAAFVVTFTTTNPYVVVPSGSLFIAVLLACLLCIVRSPQVPLRIKLMSFMVVFPIFSVVMVMALACGWRPWP